MLKNYSNILKLCLNANKAGGYSDAEKLEESQNKK